MGTLQAVTKANGFGGQAVKPALSERVQRAFGMFVGAHNLNLGCARNHEPGFVNLDVSPNVGADVVWNLEAPPLPFADDAFDCILGSHVFEHIAKRSFLPLVRELHRMLKPGGYLISVTPHGASDDFWDNPFHEQGFSAYTWSYFDRRLYERPGHAGYGDFGVDFDLQVIGVSLIPYPEFKDDPMLDTKIRHWRNVVHEVHAILQKVPRADDGL